MPKPLPPAGAIDRCSLLRFARQRPQPREQQHRDIRRVLPQVHHHDRDQRRIRAPQPHDVAADPIVHYFQRIGWWDYMTETGIGPIVAPPRPGSAGRSSTRTRCGPGPRWCRSPADRFTIRHVLVSRTTGELVTEGDAVVVCHRLPGERQGARCRTSCGADRGVEASDVPGTHKAEDAYVTPPPSLCRRGGRTPAPPSPAGKNPLRTWSKPPPARGHHPPRPPGRGRGAAPARSTASAPRSAGSSSHKQELIDLMVVAAVAQEPLLLVGPPGTAKSRPGAQVQGRPRPRPTRTTSSTC